MTAPTILPGILPDIRPVPGDPFRQQRQDDEEMIFSATLAALAGLEQEVWRYILNHKEWDGTGRKALEDVVEDQDFWDQQGGTFLETAGAGCARGEEPLEFGGTSGVISTNYGNWADHHRLSMKPSMRNRNPVFSRTEVDAYDRVQNNYRAINAVARGTKESSEFAQEMLDEMDSLIAKTSMPQAVKVFRTVKGEVGLGTFKAGDVFADGGYTWASFDRKWSQSFGSGKGADTLFEITVPRGTRALVTGKESEIVLGRGARLMVTGVEQNAEGFIVKVIIVED